MARKYKDYFNDWFDSNKYNWKDFSYPIIKYCFQYSEDYWFDNGRFNFEDIEATKEIARIARELNQKRCLEEMLEDMEQDEW